MELLDWHKITTILILSQKPKKWWSFWELFNELRNKMSTFPLEEAMRDLTIEKLRDWDGNCYNVDPFDHYMDKYGGDFEHFNENSDIADFLEAFHEFLLSHDAYYFVECEDRHGVPHFRFKPFKVKFRRCKHCGKWFVVKYNRQFCKNSCKVNYHKKHCIRCKRLDALRKKRKYWSQKQAK